MVEVRRCVRDTTVAEDKPKGTAVGSPLGWQAVACVIALFACGFPRPADVAGGDVACTDTRAAPLNCGEGNRRCADLPGVDGSRVTCREGKCQIAHACLAELADCDAE